MGKVIIDLGLIAIVVLGGLMAFKACEASGDMPKVPNVEVKIIQPLLP